MEPQLGKPAHQPMSRLAQNPAETEGDEGEDHAHAAAAHRIEGARPGTAPELHAETEHHASDRHLHGHRGDGAHDPVAEGLAL